MRLSQLTVERAEVIEAAPDRVWALLSSPEAWSLRRARFAFEVTALPSTRLRMMIGMSSRDSFSTLYQVREEVPGQIMTLHTPDAAPPRQVITLAAQRRRRATIVTVTVADTVAAGAKPDARAYWRRELEIWLGRLREVLEGRRPWPGPAMHPALLRACTSRELLRNPAQASASALISADASQVWDIVCAPASLRHADPQRVLCGGQVPATPGRQPGEMQYYVHAHPAGDGRLSASVYVLTAVEDQRSALSVQLSAPHFEVLRTLTPDAGGTRLELTYRWPASTPRRSREALGRLMAEEVRATAAGYRDLIEGGERQPGGPRDPPARLATPAPPRRE